MYARLFGTGEEGVNILSEELRWQVVTHLSFDHGRQPYNNKLAFLGRASWIKGWRKTSGMEIGLQFEPLGIVELTIV